MTMGECLLSEGCSRGGEPSSPSPGKSSDMEARALLPTGGWTQNPPAVSRHHWEFILTARAYAAPESKGVCGLCGHRPGYLSHGYALASAPWKLVAVT